MRNLRKGIALLCAFALLLTSLSINPIIANAADNWNLVNDDMSSYTTGWVVSGSYGSLTQGDGFVTIVDNLDWKYITKKTFTAPTGAFTYEVRAKMVSGGAGEFSIRGANYLVTGAISYGTSGAVQNKTQNPDKTFTLDTTIYHDYRVVVHADYSYDMYVDGTKVWTSAKQAGGGAVFKLGIDATSNTQGVKNEGTMDVDSVKLGSGEMLPASEPEPDTTAPAEVTNSTATAGDGKLTIAWTEPTDSDYDHVELSVEGLTGSAITVAKGTQSSEIPGLSNGTSYNVIIKTVDATGNTSAGVTVSGTPEAPISENWNLINDDLSDYASGWNLNGTGSVTQNPGYVTTVDTQIGAIQQYITKKDFVAPVAPFTFEVRAKMNTTGVGEFSVRGTPALVTGAIRYGAGTSGSVMNKTQYGGKSYALDTTVYHDYRMVVHADYTYDMYVDGSLAWAGGAKQTGGSDIVKIGIDGPMVGSMDIDSVKLGTGEIVPTSEPEPDTTAPAEVTNSTATAGDGKLTIAWTEPIDNDYARVELSVKDPEGAPVGDTISVNKGTQSTEITGLVNGTVYTVTIKTVDTTGNQSAGVTVSGTPIAIADTTPPAEVTNPNATAGDSRLTIAWTEPTESDYANVDIRVEDPEGTPVGEIVTVNKGTQSTQVSGLTNGTVYSVIIKTVDTSGNTSTGVTVTGTPAAYIEQWNKLDDNLDAYTSFWKITKDTSSTGTVTQNSGFVTVADSTSGNIQTYITPNNTPTAFVAPALPYTFEVKARMTLGVGEFTLRDYSKFSMGAIRYGTSGAIMNKTSGADKSYTLDTTVYHDYRIVAHTNNTYDMYVDGNVVWTGATIQTSATTTDIIKIGIDYASTGSMDIDTVRVASGELIPNDITPPAEVTGAYITEGNGTLTVAWTDPTDLNYDHAEIIVKDAGGLTVGETKTVPKGTERIVLDGLTNDSQYTISIKTVDQLINKSAGVIITGKPGIDLTAPFEVTNPVATQADGKLLVTWEDPTNIDYSHAIVSVVELPQNTTTVAKGLKSVEVTGLTNDTEYTISIKTVDVSGNKSAGVTVIGMPSRPDTKYEAEDGIHLGSSGPISNTGTVNASGGKIVHSTNSAGDGFEIINVVGGKRLKIRYATPYSGKISVYINGYDSFDMDFTSTGPWEKDTNDNYRPFNYGEVTKTVNIPAGSTIKIQYDQGDAIIAVDYIAVGGDDPNLTIPEPPVIPDPVIPDPRGWTFYVDSINGNDDNDGLSEGAAWRTVGKVSSTDFLPGDSILFKSGCAWTGEELTISDSGTAGHVITYGKYGDGPKPILNRKAPRSGSASKAIYMLGVEHVTIQDLEITNTNGDGESSRLGIYYTGTGNYRKSGIILRNLHIHNIEGISTGSAAWESSGIQFQTLDGFYIDDVLIENNNIHYNTAYGIYIRNGCNFYRSPVTESHNLIVRGNTLSDNSMGDIIIGGYKAPLVEHNIGHDAGSIGIYYGWIASMWEFNCSDAVFQYNEVFNIHKDPAHPEKYFGDGEAFDVDIVTRGNCTFQYNYSHNNYGGALLIMPNSNAALERVIYRYNISQNDHSGNGSKVTMVVYGSPKYGSDIYNNVFYNDVPNEGISLKSGVSNARYYNNIFYSLTDYTYPEEATFSNNCYYGHFAIVNDPHKVTENPMFVNVGSGGNGMNTVSGYKLQPNSPCVNAGMVIEDNGGKDFWGNQLYNGLPDIGASELPYNTTINDSITGTGTNQFNYVGNWESSSKTGAYNNDLHLSSTTDDYYEVKFTGSFINIYATKAANYGIAAVSIDGGAEQLVDLYKANILNNVLCYESPVLQIGEHILKVRNTGTNNMSSSGTVISVDRVEVSSSEASATPTPIPEATPTPDPTIYEAETAVLSEGTTPTDDTNASGGKKVFINAGKSIKFENLIGGTSITLRYLSSEGGSVTFYVNGVKQDNIWLTKATTYSDYVKVLKLQQDSTIEFQVNNTESAGWNRAFTLDYISIAGPVPTPTPIAPPPVPVNVTNNSLVFDGSGSFTDSLDNLDNVFGERSVTQANGSITGPGEIIYSSGTDEFKSISLRASFNRFAMNFKESADLKAYEVDYDSITGKFTDKKQVVLVRKTNVAAMTSYIADTQVEYVSGNITPGTKYLRVVLPTYEFFMGDTSYDKFKIEDIALKSKASQTPQYDYIIDNMSDFSRMVNGTDTSNLKIFDLLGSNNISEARMLTSSSYVERNDATIDTALTYVATSGNDFKSVYVEGYNNFAPTKDFEVWTSLDGVNYVNSSNSVDYIKPSISYEGNWLPTVLEITQLPKCTKYLQVRLPAYNETELDGMDHPRITKVATQYGKQELLITKAATPINIDGIVETNEYGQTTGDWTNAYYTDLLGIIDTNGNAHDANIYFKYDTENLYVGAKIKDPTPMVNSSIGTGIWNGDNLELFIGTEDLDYVLYPDKKNTTIASDAQVVISGGTEKGFQYYVYKNGVASFPTIVMDIKMDSDGKGYTMEAAIPLSSLGITEPWLGKSILVNPILNDGSSSGRGQWGWTTIGEGTKKYRGLWGSGSFEATEEPATEINVTAVVSPETELVTVSGKTLNVKEKAVTVLVKNESGVIAYIGQTLSDASGNYSLTFPINASIFGDGLYSVIVGGDGINNTNTTTFLYNDITAPAEVNNATAIAGDGKLTIVWTDPTDSDYDHAVMSVQGLTESAITVAKGIFSTEIEGLSNGTEYSIVIKTVDAAGNESSGVTLTGTPTALADTTAPADVTNETIIVGNGKMTVTWTDPTDSDYVQSIVSVNGQNPITVAKGIESKEITGLTNGTEYTVSIKTVDAAGNESSGVTVTGTPIAPPDTTAPAQVTNKTVIAGNGKLTITWTDPIDSDFNHVLVSVNGEDPITVAKGIGSKEFTGLTNGTQYTISIKTVDAEENVSSGVTVTGTPIAPADTTAPAEVTNKTTVAANGKLIITWTDPIDSDYDHVVVSVNGQNPITVAKGIGSKEFTGLTNGTEYTISIKTVDAAGNVSTGVTVTGTPVAPPVEDTTAPAEVTDMAAAAGNGKLTITWTDPTDVDFDHVVVSVQGLTDSALTVAKGIESKEITGLTNGTEYTISIKTVDAAGNVSTGVTVTGTPVAPPVEDTTAPAEVTNATAIAGNGKLTIVWTNPTDSDYDHAVISVQGLTESAITVAKGIFSTEIEGLSNGTEYTISIKTVDAAGNVSTGVTVTGTPIAPADTTAPAEVTNKTAIAGNGKLTIVWTNPTDSDYDHAVISVQGLTESAITVAKGIFSTEIEGLSNGTEYTISIKTVDAAGNVSTGVTVTGMPIAPDDDPTPTPAPVIIITRGGSLTTVSTVVKVTVGSVPGTVSAKVGERAFNALTDKALEAEASGQKAVVEIKVEDMFNSDTVGVEIPRTAFDRTSDETKADILVNTPLATVSFNAKAVETISNAANGGNISIGISKIDTSTLTQKAQEKVGDRPVFDFSVKAGDTEISSFGNGKAEISIPYIKKPGEKNNSIIVYYIDNTGNLKVVRGKYDPKTETVKFKTSHFSEYAVGYNEITFTDVEANTWYSDAVDFMSARGIVSGVGESKFAPERNVTRADFLIMVMKAYGIVLDTSISDNFADAGDKYYTNYLGTAKRLGLVSGIGNEKYAPEATISRQDMFVILYSVLAKLGELPTDTNSNTLENFGDTDKVAGYALEAMKLFVKSGIVSGDGKNLGPKSLSKREQTVQVLYNLLSK